MVLKDWGQKDHPSGLDRNSVQILALDVYVLSHHTLPRASFHLKTRQEYFFYDQESFGMLKLDMVELGFLPFLAPLVLIIWRGKGRNGVPGQLLVRFAPFLLQ
jgi:hypothetical protein